MAWRSMVNHVLKVIPGFQNQCLDENVNLYVSMVNCYFTFYSLPVSRTLCTTAVSPMIESKTKAYNVFKF